MQYSSLVNSVPLNYFIRLPPVSNLDSQLEVQLFQQSWQKYLSSLRSIDTQDHSSKEPNKDTSNTRDVQRLAEIPQSLSHSKEFELILGSKLDTPLCKCKYFSLKIYLKSLQGLIFPKEEKIGLEIFVYTEDKEQIMKNMKGKDILRGNFVQNLSYFGLEKVHIAYFRIQITEVSSHYINKTLSFQFKPKPSEFLSTTGWKVKSFWLHNVVVKAKDTKLKSN